MNSDTAKTTAVRRLVVVASACLVLAVLASVGLAAGTGSSGALAASPSSPNVLFIVTDDQRSDGTMDVMPETLARFASQGTTFSNAFVTTPQCCPSRSSVFSGRYVHNHGVGDLPEIDRLDQRYTIQHYLKQAGYLTGIYGKYFVEWNRLRNPPDFDKWSIWGVGYANYRANEQGVLKTIAEYATTYIRNNAVDFIQQSEANDSQPWFLYLAPHAPHSPYTPETQYQNATVPPFQPNPATWEADVTDKPRYVQSASIDQSSVMAERTGQLRTLMSVDDMVDTVFQTLDANGETQDTLAVFVSDNGFAWGEHGLRAKGSPYTDSVKVPLYLRWPGHVAAGATDGRFAANIDLAPTVLEATGVPGGIPMDGRSLLDPQQQRTRLLTEFSRDSQPWASLRTPGAHYVEYYLPPDFQRVSHREYYDLTSDPYELTNLFNDGDSGNDPNVASLAAQLAEDRVCAGSECP